MEKAIRDLDAYKEAAELEKQALNDEIRELKARGMHGGEGRFDQ